MSINNVMFWLVNSCSFSQIRTDISTWLHLAPGDILAILGNRSSVQWWRFPYLGCSLRRYSTSQPSLVSRRQCVQGTEIPRVRVFPPLLSLHCQGPSSNRMSSPVWLHRPNPSTPCPTRLPKYREVSLAFPATETESDA